MSAPGDPGGRHLWGVESVEPPSSEIGKKSRVFAAGGIRARNLMPCPPAEVIQTLPWTHSIRSEMF